MDVECKLAKDERDSNKPLFTAKKAFNTNCKE